MAYVEQAHESPASEHDPAPGVLVVETNGVMVRYHDRHLDGALVESDWHEVKLGLVGGWRDAHLRQPSYVAAREAAPAFARRLGAEAARRGALDAVKWHPWDGRPAELRPVVVLGDGARWIWDHVATLFGTERVEIVDWFHASEHVWTVAKELHGQETPETKVWARTALDYLWHSGPKPMLDWFDATQPGTPAAAAVLKRERGYFSTNAARMPYASLREQHLPIGSGAVEASAKHLIQQRMKRAARVGQISAAVPSSTSAATSSADAHSSVSLDVLQTSVRPPARQPLPARCRHSGPSGGGGALSWAPSPPASAG